MSHRRFSCLQCTPLGEAAAQAGLTSLVDAVDVVKVLPPIPTSLHLHRHHTPVNMCNVPLYAFQCIALEQI